MEDPDLQPVLKALERPSPRDYQSNSLAIRCPFPVMGPISSYHWTWLPSKGMSMFHDKLVAPQAKRQEILEVGHFEDT